MTHTIQARLFDKAEYNFNSFVIYDNNYNNVYLEEIVTTQNGFKCFEYSNKCDTFYKILKEQGIVQHLLKLKEKITLSSFEYIDGEYIFYDSQMNNITHYISSNVLKNLSVSQTSNTIYRHRYIIDENMVLIRNGYADKNKEVYKNKIVSSSVFLEQYNTLPKRSFSFSTLEVK